MERHQASGRFGDVWGEFILTLFWGCLPPFCIGQIWVCLPPIKSKPKQVIAHTSTLIAITIAEPDLANPSDRGMVVLVLPTHPGASLPPRRLLRKQ